jgi:hypothetical protein
MLTGTLVLQSGRAITVIIEGSVLLLFHNNGIIIVTLDDQTVLLRRIGIGRIGNPVILIILQTSGIDGIIRSQITYSGPGNLNHSNLHQTNSANIVSTYYTTNSRKRVNVFAQL